MEAELIYLVPYTCPHCNAALEVRQGDWPGWLRCPTCSRPSLPPELRSSTSSRRVEVLIEQDDGPIFMPLERVEKASDFRPDPFDQTRQFSAARLIFSTGLALSVIMFVVYTIERDGSKMAIFGVLAFLSLILLLRPSRARATEND
jgi:hypothetical protein